MFQQMKRMSEQSASLLLILFFSADIAFILLNIINTTLGPESSFCNIAGLCAYMKSYHLVKIFWIVILLFLIFKLTRYPGYLSWISVFVFFLFDDALEAHQRIGRYLSEVYSGYLSYDLRLGSRYLELSVLAIAGIILLIIIVWTYLQSNYVFKKISIDIFLFILALVIFGAIVDLAVAAKLPATVVLALGIIEDGGESVVFSLIIWYIFVLTLHNGQADYFLHDVIFRRLRLVQI